MIPILYASVSEGTVPSHYGVGSLRDCISCKVTEERNGSYELTMEYAAEGLHASEIQPNCIIKAKPNYTDDPQLFRIYKVGKTINARFTINAQHISYDLSGKVITAGSAGSCVAACALLQTKAGNFTVDTDKSVTAPFSVSEPSSVRSWFGGKQGSLLDLYGGEWKYDNYHASLKQARGADRSVSIRYGKNLVDLSQELNIENLCTGIIPYYIDNQTKAKTVGAKVPTGLTLDVDKDLAVDFSHQVNPESATPIVTQLANLAAAYIANNNLTNVLNSISLSFVQLEGLSERVDLCDTCHIYFEALGISASVKCISTTWDVLEDRYIETTFGNARSNIADTIANTQKEIEDRPSTSAMQQAVKRATELITGNLGGYVIIHDSNGDGEPDEILIMDTADINTATNVIRMNQAGIGLSNGNGYAGPYQNAITYAGIVADAITTGTLNADLIKAGTIEDAAGNSTIDMTNGAAVMKNFKAKLGFDLINADGDSRVKMEHFSTTLGGVGGSVQIFNENDAGVFDVFAGATGGRLHIRNNNEDERVRIFVGNLQPGGFIYIYDQNDTLQIGLDGPGGVINCVTVNQSSSRKVKENIKPIEDAKKILELDAVSFDYKNKSLGTDKRGFIAEDVQKILPNLVTPETEEKTASLDYIGMIPYLQAVLKEQEQRIKELEEKLKTKGD